MGRSLVVLLDGSDLTPQGIKAFRAGSVACLGPEETAKEKREATGLRGGWGDSEGWGRQGGWRRGQKR